MIHTGYVLRMDARIDGSSAYAVNRDMLPESIMEAMGG